MSNFQCLSCSKAGFRDQVAVARHMSQPHSGCSTWLQDLICLRDLSDDSMNTDELDEPNIPSGGPQAEVEFTFGDRDKSFGGSGESGGQASGEGLLPNGASDFVDQDPKSSWMYGKGYTFLNLFNSDENSIGQKDWEITSWLLCLGLSMGKIDGFLSLEISFVKIQGLPISFSSAKELVYTTAQYLCCVYPEWMTGDDTWNMQSALPKDATLLGTILSSNKMNISTMTGDRVAHPLLISLANINMST
ncbi:uncharacterized protein F5891DRAFT_987739 [Suillus fuscotomentosus]|uniref:Uncharacterized protein n=1 Tax=Suillus fuscotomentosus TaxID=1912939 RepID=A0AAD4DPQ4_9AGAM|nr:uncharacterized protein F5891DRAFT_987739 [Suillus fuscotomentosus]KAG1888897.1 hypothetical protein F5891DRAFT_987739 [Suillus fuscotomentosus]